MGCCSNKHNSRPRNRSPQVISFTTRQNYRRRNIIVPLNEEIRDPSEISCNFIYDDDNLETCISAALTIVLLSLQNEYDLCCICADRTSTISTKNCKHKILCTKCYQDFCKSKLLLCPICRAKLDSEDPFMIESF